MRTDPKKLIQILKNENYISEKDLLKAENEAIKKNIPFLDYLLQYKIITKDLLGQAIAEFFKIPYVNLAFSEPQKELAQKVPEDIANNLRVILYEENENEVKYATDNPAQKDLVTLLQNIVKNKKIILNYAIPDDIDSALIIYRQTLKTRFSQIIQKQQKIAPEILNEIFEDAVIYRASDIHFEPQEKEVIIRFRIDGVLHEAGRILKEYYENILNRIKIQSHLRIDEHYSAQDGSLRHSLNEKKLDMRISIIPVMDGEKIAIRILPEYIHTFALEELGLLKNEQNQLKKYIKKPFGMILVTGPTGSGKTTTLYSILKTLNNPGINITTIEDPVEYKISGTNQIQVNEEKELTFANGLRSIVRQDPDIIMVGEIRDKETAEISVNAALTGHLLLSTFHANDAATAIPRLLDMNIEPFLLASTLQIVIAQRLVRKLCENCRYSITYKKQDLLKKYPFIDKYFDTEEITLYESKKCKVCGSTGFKGRLGIFEAIEITPEIQDFVLKNPSSKEIWDKAKKLGAQTLFDDGIKKTKNGLTSLEELLRVAEPPNS